MRDEVSSPSFLLGCFAEFYEEIASIRLALAEGRLPAYLATGDEPPPALAADLAARVSARLAEMLQQQARVVRRDATATEIEAHATAQYVMAALADEIFILELDWAGRDAWLDALIEYKLFQSNKAGRHFFELAAQILRPQNRSALHTDLASVFLLALQLGFKGLYRGHEGEATLRSCRQQLYRLVNAGERDHRRSRAAFFQAYQHRLSGENDERLAPLTPWYALGRIALASYLALSTVVWLVLLHPFQSTFGG